MTATATQPGDSDRAKGQTVMENILAANPDVNSVFATNDLMALGAFEAIKSAKKTGIIVVGFDANPDAATSILASEMIASIAKPKQQGQVRRRKRAQNHQGRQTRAGNRPWDKARRQEQRQSVRITGTG